MNLFTGLIKLIAMLISFIIRAEYRLKEESANSGYISDCFENLIKRGASQLYYLGFSVLKCNDLDVNKSVTITNSIINIIFISERGVIDCYV